MIIKTSAGQYYDVVETNDPNLAHVWFGYPLKFFAGKLRITAGGERARRANKPELVRKAATVVVDENGK